MLTTGITTSLWLDEGRIEDKKLLLDKNINTDICIIGAGIAGLSIAYRLACEGKAVVVLEAKKIGSGETGRTTAHLSNALDDHYMEMEKIFGTEGIQLAARSHTAAINYIANVSNKENITCDFQYLDGYLFSNDSSGTKIINKELLAAQRAGLHVTQLSCPPENTIDMQSCLIFTEQAQFHPLKYLLGLANAIRQKGGYIYEYTPVQDIQSQSSVQIKTAQNYIITANNVVVATNVPINDKFIMHSKLAPNRTYVIGALIPSNTLKSALYWDTVDPYHYVRLYQNKMIIDHESYDVLIIGGEDHRTGRMPYNPHEPFARLELWGRKYFPQMTEIKYRWSGQIIEPVDYLAFIGRNPLDSNKVYIVTGDSGNGITHGTIAGILVSDLILGRHNAWTELYRPARKSLKAWRSFLHHNFEALLSYLSYLSPDEVKSEEKIAVRQGAVMRCGLKKIAIFRNEQGVLQKCSAVCSHLQSIVHWNPIEATWDCPAHGSRFTADGQQVLNGLATKPLKPLKSKPL